MNSLTQDCKCVGTAFIFDKDMNAEVKVSINKRKQNGEISYSALIVEDDKVKNLGFVRFCVKDTSTTVFGPEQSMSRKINKYIWISRIDSFHREQFKGVGTALMQAVMERAWKEKDGCKGEVLLAATENSIPFYYKLDMKCVNGPLWDKAVLRELEQVKIGKPSKKFEEELGNVQMCMPFEAIGSWKEKIMKAPILNKTPGTLC